MVRMWGCASSLSLSVSVYLSLVAKIGGRRGARGEGQGTGASYTVCMYVWNG